MRKIVPQRVIRNRIRLLLMSLILFIATLAICLIIFFVLLPLRFHIISPLAYLKQYSINKDTLMVTVKGLCQKEKLSCEHILLQGSTVEVTLDSGIIADLSINKNLEDQLASLQKVASQLTIKGKELKRIDFRFNQVVVSF